MWEINKNSVNFIASDFLGNVCDVVDTSKCDIGFFFNLQEVQ